MEKEVKPVVSFKEYFQNAKEAVVVFKWVTSRISTPESKKKLKKMFVWLGIMIAIQTMLPWGVSYIFTGLIKKNIQTVYLGFGIFAFGLIAHKIADQYQAKAREWLLGLHGWKLDDHITESFFEKSLGQHAHEGATLSVSNIDKGRWKVLDLQGMLLFNGIPTIAQLFFAFISLTILSLVAGTVMFAVIMIYIGFSFYLNYRVNQVCIPLDRDFRALNRRRVERWTNVERVKTSGKEIEELQEMSSIFSLVMKKERDFWIWFISIAGIRSILNAIGLIMIMSWGAWLVWKNVWSVGLLYPLYSWTNKVSDNIWQLGTIEHQLNWNLPAVKSLIEALEIPPAIVQNENAVDIDSKIPHRISFVDVCHTYPKDTHCTEDAPPALKGINLKIEPGEKVALVGTSGAGKTTVMRKLLRFDDPTSGRILIDDLDLRNITEASWRKGIGYIPQQAQVFDGTIRYNLTYGLDEESKKNYTDEKLWELMRSLQIDFESRLTNGLDTRVGKNGIKLSGGQAQRLMIGAAVIKKPWLLVIDEATSSLDSTTEKKVQEGLKEVLSSHSTSALIVAHRLSTVRTLCSKFIVLKTAAEVKNGEGQIEAVASSFEELYEKSYTFRNLANDQGVKI